MEPDDELWISLTLKAEADRHEPDLDRIRRRIREREIDVPSRRSTWLLPAAAAATFVAITAGAIAAVNGGQTPGPTGQVEVVGPAGATTQSTTAGSTSAPAPTSSSSSTRPRVSSSASPAGKADPTGAASSTQVATPADVQLQLVAAKPGQVVNLPDGAEDWIAAGGGPPSETIRRKSGPQEISGPHVTGDPAAEKVDGPFAVTWTGGMPEASHAGSRTWLSVSGPPQGPKTGFEVRVPAGKQAGVLVLYVGAEGADATLQARLGGRSAPDATRTKLKAAPGGKGYVVTIRFHTAGAVDALSVDLVGGSGGSVSLAAAVLR